MLTINYAIQNNIPLDRPLTSTERAELIKENKDKDFSYLCLLKEVLSYRNTSVETLLTGWGGIKLIK